LAADWTVIWGAGLEKALLGAATGPDCGCWRLSQAQLNQIRMLKTSSSHHLGSIGIGDLYAWRLIEICGQDTEDEECCQTPGKPGTELSTIKRGGSLPFGC
jgi:hypothetical protein